MTFNDVSEKLTAYLLEELSDTEKHEVEDLLNTDEAAQKSLEEIRGAIELATAALGLVDDSELSLNEEQRDTIRQMALDPSRRASQEVSETEEPEESSALIDMRVLRGASDNGGAADVETKQEDYDEEVAALGGGFTPVLKAAKPKMAWPTKVVIGVSAVAIAASIALVVAVPFMIGSDEDAELESLRAQLAELEKKGASEEEKIALAAQIKEQEEENTAEPLEEEPKEEEPSEKEPSEEDPKGGDAIAMAGGDKPKPRPGNKPTPKPSSSSASSSGSSPKPPGKPKDELDALLGGGTPSASNKPKPKPPASSGSGGGGGGGGGDVKPSLERADVQKGMSQVAGKVKACGGGPGTVTIKVIIGDTGRVISATATGSYAGTPVGNCAAKAVKKAKFPKSQKNLTVRYPFKL